MLTMGLLASAALVAAEPGAAPVDGKPVVPPAEAKAVLAGVAPGPAAPARPAEPSSPGIVVLDPVEVRAERVVPKVDLPRVVGPKALDRSVETRDSFLTEAGRAEQRKRKYLSFLDRSRLNRVAMPGSPDSAEKRAELADRQAQFATGMSDVAVQIQLAAASGEDPAELKKLTALYRDLYLSRPR